MLILRPGCRLGTDWGVVDAPLEIKSEGVPKMEKQATKTCDRSVSPCFVFLNWSFLVPSQCRLIHLLHPSPGPPGMAFPRPKTKRNGVVSVSRGVGRLRLTSKSHILSFYLVQKFLEGSLGLCFECSFQSSMVIRMYSIGDLQWIVDSTYCLKGVAPFVLHDCLMWMGEHLQKQSWAERKWRSVGCCLKYRKRPWKGLQAGCQ